MTTTYEELTAWRAYQSYFPPELRIGPERGPVEQWVEVGGARVHLDRWSAPRPRAVVVALHGTGGYGRFLAPLCAAVRELGCEAVAPDLPLFGLTEVPDRRAVRYAGWVELVAELVGREAARAPVVLFGASIGGRLAYDVAALTGLPVGVIATCLLDPRAADVRRAVAHDPVLARLAPLARRLPQRLLDVPVPLSFTTRMSRMSNDPALSRLCARDRQGGGGRVSLAFLLDWLDTAPAVDPEAFTTCPVLLVHPADDRWTPLSFSERFLRRISAPTAVVPLQGAGHLPVEEPGLGQLRAAVAAFLDEVAPQPG